MPIKGAYQKPPRYAHPRNNPERFRAQMTALRTTLGTSTAVESVDIGLNLAEHVADLDNPHAVTYLQTGAAPLVHTHEEFQRIKSNEVLMWLSM